MTDSISPPQPPEKVEAYGTVTHPPGTVVVTVTVPRELTHPGLAADLEPMMEDLRSRGALVEVRTVTEHDQPAEAKRVPYFSAISEEIQAMLIENIDTSPEDWTVASRLRLLAGILDTEDAKRGIVGHDIQDDLRWAADFIATKTVS